MAQGRNLKVLLMAPNFYQAIGTMAKYLADSAKDIDFYFFNDADIKLHKREFLNLVSYVDIVHWLSNLSYVTMPLDIDIREFEVPNVGAIYHLDEGLKGFWQEKEANKVEFANHCDIIHVISKEWENIIQNKTKKIVCLAHPIINPQKFVLNRNISRPRKPFRIGTFGFARELKGRKRIDVLLDALIILKKNNYNFELVVQGPFWKNLMGYFSDHSIPFLNLGYRPSYLSKRSYRHIDLYVCTSDIEGGPLPVLEALASGVPVVSTPVGISPEALSLGGGILVNKNNPKGLAIEIAKIIDNPKLYKIFSQEAIGVAENFSWDKVGEEYKTMYTLALQSKEKKDIKISSILPPKFQRGLQLIRDIRREQVEFRDFIRNKRFLNMILRFIN